MQQIRARADWLDEPVRFSHYRDKDQVIEKGRDVWGIGVKKAATVQVRDGEGLRRESISGVPHCVAVPVDWLWWSTQQPSASQRYWSDRL